MKKLTFTLLIALSCSSVFAQKIKVKEKVEQSTATDFPVKDNHLYYEGVVEVDPNAKQAELYRAGRTWFVDTYVDAKEVLQMDDKAEGRMVGKGIYNYVFINGINVSQIAMRFVLSLDIKDGKYRYRIYNFTGQNTNSSLLGGTSGPAIYGVDYDQCFIDYKAGKRTKYNLKVLQGMDTQVGLIVVSLKKAMTDPKAGKDDF